MNGEENALSGSYESPTQGQDEGKDKISAQGHVQGCSEELERKIQIWEGLNSLFFQNKIEKQIFERRNA
ncbi:unnamed protein product [marine sediment metagenome]|uniref:Uncharacterized protein n=1 Tax=marine sediment metagenome TaxID=412755 RepID=X1JQC9_9ZZZZ